ncbi:MAG: hypothetical protein IPN02_07950 [Candidatus Microthrix sp.]|uniref:Uncharacterized protein n=1 Tax=Candidatus Neomicrothrix subdominans TaxID=2954438 RepID=A0A936NAP0_9ACTN|nr:hypothetical protein [Candidatus Microthrix subdominans]
MSIEARTTTLSEALTQLDLLTPAAPEQLPRDGSTKDRYTAPAPGEMQYRANKLLGELIEKMRRPPRLKMRPALVGHDLSELIEWLDYTMGTNVSDPEPARLLQESTLQPLDEESDPVRIYDVARTALQLRYGEGLSWARAIFSALEVGGAPELCDSIEPTGRNAADVWQVVQHLEHGGRSPSTVPLSTSPARVFCCAAQLQRGTRERRCRAAQSGQQRQPNARGLRSGSNATQKPEEANEMSSRHTLTTRSTFRIVPDSLVFDPALSAAAKEMYAVLLSFAGDTSQAWPGIPGIRERLITRGVQYGHGTRDEVEALIPAERTISTHLGELVDRGWVYRRRRMNTSSKTHICQQRGEVPPWGSLQQSLPVPAESCSNDHAESCSTVAAESGRSVPAGTCMQKETQ